VRWQQGQVGLRANTCSFGSQTILLASRDEENKKNWMGNCQWNARILTTFDLILLKIAELPITEDPNQYKLSSFYVLWLRNGPQNGF